MCKLEYMLFWFMILFLSRNDSSDIVCGINFDGCKKSDCKFKLEECMISADILNENYYNSNEVFCWYFTELTKSFVFECIS